MVYGISGAFLEFLRGFRGVPGLFLWPHGVQGYSRKFQGVSEVFQDVSVGPRITCEQKVRFGSS